MCLKARTSSQVQIDGNALADQCMVGYVSVLSGFISSHMHAKHTHLIYFKSAKAVIGGLQCLNAKWM